MYGRGTEIAGADVCCAKGAYGQDRIRRRTLDLEPKLLNGIDPGAA